MLIFNLKKCWFDKIRSGEKKIEFREIKPFWTSRLRNEGCLPKDGKSFVWESDKKSVLPILCLFRNGYTRRAISARITKVEIVDGRTTDLAVNAPVYAIHFTDTREVGVTDETKESV